MEQRADIITTMQVDHALILLSAITWREVSWMLAESAVPLEVAARVLDLPRARCAIDESLDLLTLSN